ncbi:MAG: MoaD/ThiS family protein [Paraglaciecola sp.]|uniref:MoaD/ThiS family protein n=1 Tax=Paraglaciecola sp. TaxID=1920173 RepID=UPI00329A3102
MLTILFFGHLKEILETDCLRIELSQNQDSIDTVAKVRKLLQLKGNLWTEYLEYGMALVAVNQEMSSEDTVVNDGDEIAFFPPVTGG